MEIVEPAYPALESLFGAWLHQDWEPEFGTVENALEEFVDSESEEDAQAALTEARRLAEEDEEELPELLKELGCCVDPEALGMTSKQFLEDVVVATLERALEGAA